MADNGVSDLRRASDELKRAVELVRAEGKRDIPSAVVSLPPAADGWNFTTFEKYINQRFGDLALQLRERYEAQQSGVSAALSAAEKAVQAALVAAEKAVDKAEGAQQLRNEAQNEFRKSLSDLSGLMWTTKEGQAAVDALRREVTVMLRAGESRVATLEGTSHNLWATKDGQAAVESLRREWALGHEVLTARVSSLENFSANIQGRIWAVSGLFAIVALILELATRFFVHTTAS